MFRSITRVMIRSIPTSSLARIVVVVEAMVFVSLFLWDQMGSNGSCGVMKPM